MSNNVEGNSCGFKGVTVDAADESRTFQSCVHEEIKKGNDQSLPQSHLPTLECSQVASSFKRQWLLETSDYVRKDYTLPHKAGRQITSK